jgi:hypothetical protein
MCQDSITGIVIFPITVPVMVKSVAIALPVLNWQTYHTVSAKQEHQTTHSIN